MSRQTYWTKERVLEGVRLFVRATDGPLPKSDSTYRAARAGNTEYPSPYLLLKYWHSVGRAFLEAGADPRRVSLRNVKWTPEDDDVLLEMAGTISLRRLGRKLCRPQYGLRARLNEIHGLQARNAQGFLSASEVAREYQCPVTRVKRLIRSGQLPARFDSLHNQYLVDPADLAKVKAVLVAPKVTHKSYAPDVGDYYHRYNIKRTKKVTS
jgi:hypothetical protein